MRRSIHKIPPTLRAACFALLLSGASGARAAPLTFDQALDRASQFAPSLAARDRQLEAERLKA